MFKALGAAFRTADLRRKLLFTLFIMAIYRFGTYVPAPFVSYGNIQTCMTQMGDDEVGFMTMINMFSGGGMLQLSIFALGIMPYITASIIIQLLRVVIPRFEELHKEGQSGTAKLTEYTRYLTIGLGVLQSSVVVSVANRSLFEGCSVDPIPNETWWKVLFAIMTMTAGTGLIMWLAEQITERGIGNGMSILIFTGIAASFPTMLWEVNNSKGIGYALGVFVLFLLIMAVVAFVEQSQRRIPVQYAKRVVGRRTYGGSATYLPLKINMANVIPVIFASSILMLPQMVAQFGDPSSSWVAFVNKWFASGPNAYVYFVLYGLLIVGFTFFYTSISFNTEEVADNMKRYGGFVPGYRPGTSTANYLRYVSNRLTTVGSIYLAIVALIPTVLFAKLGIMGSSFGGTSIMILIGVGLQTVKDIDAQLQQRHYEGFLK
ncbi:MAG: preprotein translocase subunit SecY [Actinomycetaceae bacterium]|nr:preprotein translocase subunit SecY [Actinomycetaceae bacterium]